MEKKLDLLMVGSHPIRGGSIGGPTFYLGNLARCLSNNYNVTVISNSNLEKETIIEESGVKIILLKKHKSSTRARLIKMKEIGKNYDLIHVNGFKLFSLKSKLKKPLVTTIHGYLTLEGVANGKFKEGSLKFKLNRWIEKKAVQKSDAIIAVDKRIHDWVISTLGAKPEKVFHIPNAADEMKFNPEVSGNRIRDKYNLNNKPVILFFKAFSPKNGPEIIIKAMPEILKINTEAVLMMAGDGPLKNQLMTLSKNMGLGRSVIFTGHISSEEAPEYYAASDVVTVPSVQVGGVEEATSLTMLEAMASGKPVVVSNIGGLKETIAGQDENIGLLFEEKNSTALANEIIMLLVDPALCRSIGKNAREFIVRERTWSFNSKKVIGVYEFALNKKS